MPTLLRRISSRRSWRLRISNWQRRPLPRLVRHFLARLVHSNQGGEADFELGAGALLGILAAPAAFETFLQLNKYSTLLDWLRKIPPRDYFVTSAPDKYLYIAIAMAVTGIMTVLKWDRIVPDAQDYLNLAPQPVAPRTILTANLLAIGIAVLVFVVDANTIPSFLFPAFVTAAAQSSFATFLGFVAAHAFCLTLASFFTFFSVFAFLGGLAAVLPRALFEAISSWLRGVLLVAFLALLPSAFAAPALLRQLSKEPDSLLSWLPSFWFLGLYQQLQHRATPVLAELGERAIPGTLFAAGCMALAYAFSYRRRFAAVLEGQRSRTGRKRLGLLAAFLDLFCSSRSGFERACHGFVVRALLRNEAQRLCLAVALGLGWLMAIQSVLEAPAGQRYPLGLLQAPLALAYLLILGLRFAFEIPASLPSSWIYRTTIDARANQTLGVARRVMVAFLAPFVLLPCGIYFVWRWDWRDGLLSTAFVLALSLCAMEIVLSGYRKVPLTCPLPAVRQNFLVLCLVQFLGFEAFIHIGSACEQWMLMKPVRFLWLPVFMVGARLWQQHRLSEAREAGEVEEGLTFDSAPPPEVEELHLSTGG